MLVVKITGTAANGLLLVCTSQTSSGCRNDKFNHTQFHASDRPILTSVTLPSTFRWIDKGLRNKKLFIKFLGSLIALSVPLRQELRLHLEIRRIKLVIRSGIASSGECVPSVSFVVGNLISTGPLFPAGIDTYTSTRRLNRLLHLPNKHAYHDVMQLRHTWNLSELHLGPETVAGNEF